MEIPARTASLLSPRIFGIVALLVATGCSAEATSDVAEDELRVCKSGTTIKGIDVSKWQGRPNFDAVAATGRVFVITRTSDGLAGTDPVFISNYKAIKDAGMIRGTYQFFRPTQDAATQAAALLADLRDAGGLQPDDLPPVLDLEVMDSLPASIVAARAQTWLDTVEAAIGKKPILYTSAAMSAVTSKLSNYVLWVANYGASCPRMPAGYTQWAFWQYSQTGRISGITSRVDENYFQGDRAALLDYTMAGTAGPAPRSIRLPSAPTEDLSAPEMGPEAAPGSFEVPMGYGYMGATASAP